MKLSKIIILTVIFAASVILKSPAIAQEPPGNYIEPDISYASGKVLEIIKEKENKELSESFQNEQITQLVKVRVLNGEYNGETVEVENYITSNPVYDIKLKAGQRVLLNIENTPEGPLFYVTDIERYPVLMITLGLFLALLLIIGGKKGIQTIISLCITALLVFFILVPAILNNFPPIPSAVFIALISTMVTMAVIGGINIKSLAAGLGSILSVSLAGFVALLVINYAPLTGFHDQESAMLWMSRPDLNFPGILAAAVIIGALGAVMDVGMSIASSISEFKNVNPGLTPAELVKSGMNVGRDVMGTMANTLILAYIGGAFSLVLLAANAPLLKLINLNSISTEITAAITGSIGIALCVPITAITSAYLIDIAENSKKQEEDLPEEGQDSLIN